ncbi:MAG: TadE/TadG family type IV pilus assembly protein [Alphaproteobacteria bacterium]
MTITSRFLQYFRRSCCGSALIEFALVAPLLLALLFGAVEFGRYVLITQKVEKSGYTLGNVLTQYTAADIAQQSTFDGVFNQYATVMAPYGSDPATQRVIFTSVTKDPSDHQVKIDWQKSGGGTLDNGQTVSIVDGLAASAIVGNNPAPEQVATFSGNVNITNLLVPGSSTGMADGENMIVTEVFYQYKPLVAPLLKSVGITVTPTTLVRRTFMRPREGDLNVTSCPAGTANWPPGCSGPYGTMNSGDTTNVPNTATGYTGSEDRDLQRRHRHLLQPDLHGRRLGRGLRAGGRQHVLHCECGERRRPVFERHGDPRRPSPAAVHGTGPAKVAAAARRHPVRRRWAATGTRSTGRRIRAGIPMACFTRVRSAAASGAPECCRRLPWATR